MVQPKLSRPSPGVNGQALDLSPVVLLVDDNPTIRELYKEVLLEGQPFRVLTAADGQEALTLAETWVPDLVVTDVRMPRLDGFGLIRALRRLYPSVPVIVLTATEVYGERLVEDIAAELGALATFSKPCDLSCLQKAILSAVPFLGPASLAPVTDGIAVA